MIFNDLFGTNKHILNPECVHYYAVIQQREARFYDCIMKQMRPEPEYFRVGFYGLGFPSFLQVNILVLLPRRIWCKQSLKIRCVVYLFGTTLLTTACFL